MLCRQLGGGRLQCTHSIVMGRRREGGGEGRGGLLPEACWGPIALRWVPLQLFVPTSFLCYRV